MLLDPPTLCLLLRHAPKKPRKQQQQHTGAQLSCKESQEGGGGTEQGSRRCRAEERFFGKSANPITGSGAALVSLAALKSHFNCLSLSAPFCRSFLLFSSISTHHGLHSACFPSHLACFTRFHERGRAIYAYHRQNTLSPFGCVMSKCVRSLQHRSPCASQNWSLSGFCRAAAASPHQVSLSVCSA